MLSFQARIGIFPWTQYFKKIATKTRKYNTDDDIQGQMCKNVTRNISAKIQEPIPKYTTKISK